MQTGDVKHFDMQARLLTYPHLYPLKTYIMIKRILILIIIMFISYTLVNKILNINAFVINIAKVGVFKGGMVDVAVFYALISELLCIVLLITKEHIGILVTLLVISSYTVYLSYLGFSGIYVMCGCGGILNNLTFYRHLAVNVILIITLLYLSVTHEDNR